MVYNRPVVFIWCTFIYEWESAATKELGGFC